MRKAYWWSIGLLLLPLQVMAAVDCSVARKPHAVASDALQLAPIADELGATGMTPGGAGFAATIDNRVTVEEAASRLHQQTCATASSALANARPGTPGATPPAAGGTKLRFDMTQNGKRMTADEFDAWMKAQGVRVVKAPTTTATAAPAPAPVAPAPTPSKKKKP